MGPKLADGTSGSSGARPEVGNETLPVINNSQLRTGALIDIIGFIQGAKNTDLLHIGANTVSISSGVLCSPLFLLRNTEEKGRGKCVM